MKNPVAKLPSRILEFDLLRGFFILVIIIDHIQRWPSPLTYITGEGRLWVSAAEGFFIISGLLIGYLRGYKGLKHSLSHLSKLLVKRAALLYLWSVIITFIGVALVIAFKGDPSLVPKLPETSGLTYIWQVITQQYVFDWIYFLRLYWIMLLVTPLALFLFRKKLWWLVPIISVGVYITSMIFGFSEAALQWQVLFFIPATIGFHFESICNFFRSRQTAFTALSIGLIGMTLATMIISYFWVLGWDYVESDNSRLSRDTYVMTRGWLDPFFTKDPLAYGRILLSLVWFGGLLAIVHAGKPYITKAFGWLLVPFGTYSLTAYTLQAIILLFVQFFVAPSTNWTLNALISILSVLLIWITLKIPLVRKILPQ